MINFSYEAMGQAALLSHDVDILSFFFFFFGYLQSLFFFFMEVISTLFTSLSIVKITMSITKSLKIGRYRHPNFSGIHDSSHHDCL